MKSAIITALIVLSIIALRIPRLSAQTDQDKFVWGTAVNGLQMSLSVAPPKSPSDIPVLTLTLHNVGTSDLKVELGADCKEQPPNDTSFLSLKFTDSAGKSEDLKFPDSPCAGAVGVFVLLVPAGKSVSTPVNLQYYKVSPTLLGNTYTVQAELAFNWSLAFNRGQAPVDYWMGSITSNKVQIHFPPL